MTTDLRKKNFRQSLELEKMYNQDYIFYRAKELARDLIVSGINSDYMSKENVYLFARYYNAVREKDISKFINSLELEINKYFMSSNFNRFMVYYSKPFVQKPNFEDIIIFDFTSNKRIIFRFKNAYLVEII